MISIDLSLLKDRSGHKGKCIHETSKTSFRNQQIQE